MAVQFVCSILDEINEELIILKTIMLNYVWK